MRAKLRFSGNLALFAKRLALRREGELRLRPAETFESPRHEEVAGDHVEPVRRQRRAPIKAYKSCPRCDSTNIRPARPKRMLDRLLVFLGLPVLLCRECRCEFRSFIWRWETMWYARCPQCASLVLRDWQEKYHLPPAYERALVALGAKAQRCEPCRHNFVSLRPRWRRITV